MPLLLILHGRMLRVILMDDMQTDCTSLGVPQELVRPRLVRPWLGDAVRLGGESPLLLLPHQRAPREARLAQTITLPVVKLAAFRVEREAVMAATGEDSVVTGPLPPCSLLTSQMGPAVVVGPAPVYYSSGPSFFSIIAFALFAVVRTFPRPPHEVLHACLTDWPCESPQLIL